MVARVNLLLGRPAAADEALDAADATLHPRARVEAGVVGALVAAARETRRRAGSA